MSNILFVSHSAGRTGAPIGLLAFMRWLRANTDHRFGTILGAPGPLEPEFRALGPTLTLNASFLARSRFGRRVRRMLPVHWRDERSRLRAMATRGAYDLVYSNTITNGRILDALSPVAPVLTHVHELGYWIARAGADNLRGVVRRTSAYVAASGAVADHLVTRHSIAAQKVTVVYEHVRDLPALPTAENRAAARAALGVSPDAVVVGGCGGDFWRKGRDLIPQLLLALRRLQPSRRFEFIWIGPPGSAEEEFHLRHDLQAAGIAAQFHARGETDNPFLLYPAIDVFALLSRDDPYPLACLEVAALEVPVVCFEDAGGMPEFVHDGCGFTAPYLAVEAMAGHIVRLASDADLARRCGQRARQKVAAENTLATTGPQLRAVMEQLLRPSAPARRVDTVRS